LVVASQDRSLTSIAAGMASDELDDRQELALLHRILHRLGYSGDKCVTGHISAKLDDESLLITTAGYGWDEISACNIARIDLSGTVLDSEGIDGTGIVGKAARTFHTVIHQARPEMKVAVHSHPAWATVWAAAGRVPPIYDQFGSFVKDDLTVTGEYRDDVSHVDEAVATVQAMGRSDNALLRSHGVLVLAKSIQQAHTRCAVLEYRCRLAWHVQALGETPPMSAVTAAKLASGRDTTEGLKNFFKYAVRRELREDPNVLL
jgi:L-fuculose-phosphate aldolase